MDAREAITQAHHNEWASVVAALAKRFGSLDIAEEAAAEAFAAATSWNSRFESIPRCFSRSTFEMQ